MQGFVYHLVKIAQSVIISALQNLIIVFHSLENGYIHVPKFC